MILLNANQNKFTSNKLAYIVALIFFVSTCGEPTTFVSSLAYADSGSCSSNDVDVDDATSDNLDVPLNTSGNYTVTCKKGGPFYVSTTGNNSNNGSQSLPWKDIQFGVDQLSAGETLIVSAGSYRETVLFSGKDDSGSASAPISIIGREGAIVDGGTLSPSDRQGLITIRDAQFIMVKNLELSNFRTAKGVEMTDTPVGILIEGTSSNISLINNRIHHIENLSTCDQTSDCGPAANGIAVYGNTTAAITGLILNGNEVYQNILAASEALTINGNVDGFKVLNNHVHDNNNIGIDIIGYESDVCASCTDEQNRARNGVIKGNRSINNSTNLALGNFSNNPWYGDDGGSAGGFYVDGGRNIIFDGNHSSRNDLGFEFASEHSGKSSDEILMINNYVYKNREVGLTIGGYSEDDSEEGGGSATNIYVYNNSFYKNAGWGTEINLSYRVINATFTNNILFGKSSVSEIFYPETNGQHQHVDWSNNLWWAPDVSDRSGVPGLASSIVQDPLFTSAQTGNLDLLVNSPAIDKAQLQTNLTHWNDSFWQDQFRGGVIDVHGKADINQKNRTSNRLDIGADEF